MLLLLCLDLLGFCLRLFFGDGFSLFRGLKQLLPDALDLGLGHLFGLVEEAVHLAERGYLVEE